MTNKTIDRGAPIPGRQYALTGIKGAACIANGSTWAESEVTGMKDPVDRFVGKTGEIAVAGLRIAVRVTDVKMSYGRMRYNVTPVAGTGSVWVETVYFAQDN